MLRSETLDNPYMTNSIYNNMTHVRIAFLLFLSMFVPVMGWAQVQVGPGQTYPDIGTAAHARVVHPGDTVFVHGGTYTNSPYAFGIDSLIGTPDRWITIMPFGQDSVSIHEQYTFQVSQYLRISGLHFYGNDPTQATRVFHLLFFDYQYACFTSNHDIIIENCTFTDLNNTGKSGITGSMLKLDGTDNFQVLNCSFINGTYITDGIGLNADRNGVISHCTFENMPGDGSHCKGGAKDITYEKNLFINCATGGLDIGGDTGPQFFCPLGATWEADSIKVYANIFIGGTTGIKLSSCHNSFIFNNTCFKSTSFAFRSLNASSNGITLDNNYVYNNIFTTYSTNHIYLNASANFNYSTEYFKNNLFHDYRYADPATISWSEMPGVNVSGSLIGDPEFTDTLNRDFSLRAGSPAIGAGWAMPEPVTDYRDLPYSLTARSIGAVELQGAACAFATPLTVTFGATGKTLVGTRDTTVITVTNCGTVATSFTAAATPANYSILGSATSSNVEPNGTASFSVVFAPTTIGAYPGTLSFTGGLPASVPLTGVGAGVMATATGEAGNVATGDCQDFAVTITNGGNVDWNAGAPAISGTNAADFTIVSGPTPNPITAQAMATMTINFCPTAIGTETASLTFPSASPAPISSFDYSLIGTGLGGGVAEKTSQDGFLLGQSYPNPTNGPAVVTFTLPVDAPVRIDLIDAKGVIVRTALTGRMTAGDHSVTLDAKDIASGIYFYTLISGDVRLMRQMTIMR